MPEFAESDLVLADGRTLHVYDGGGAGRPVIWLHGTPQIGAVPEPLLRPDIRWLSYDRPGYGGSTAQPGRPIASAATDTARIADFAGVDRFAVVGHSGGGTHALACAALLPDRVSAVVALGSIGPFEADGLDWWTGMVAPEELQAAVAGRRRLAELLATDPFDPESFTASDHAAVRGTWSALGRNAGLAAANGFDGQIDDDLAYVRPWGFPAAQVRARTLLVHGTADRIAPLAHSEWLAKNCTAAELRILPEAGHISVLDGAPAALDWLADVTGATP